MTPPKLLVVGSISGNIQKAFEKISKLHTKQNFSFAIIVGSVFKYGEDHDEDITALINGSITLPLPIYFTLGDDPLPKLIIEKLQSSETSEVIPNLVFLGRRATLKTSDGIKIVALGGKLVQNDVAVQLGNFEPLFYEGDVKFLTRDPSCDILITNQWPADIAGLSKQPIPETLLSDQGVKPISDLCTTLKPRYHFASSPEASWEREPFAQVIDYTSLENEQKFTRFRSLAGCECPAKEWMAAFNFDPNVPPPAPNATPSPFSHAAGTKRRRMEDGADKGVESYSRFAASAPNHYDGQARKRRRTQPGQEQCFMCVNGPEFRQHMVVSIGEESFLTVPKGPLPLASTFPILPWPGHALIIPMYHAAQDMQNGPRAAALVQREFEEMTKYRKALCQMLQATNNGTLGAVCWDANRTGIRHMHWQFMAALTDVVKKGLVEAAFRALRENYQYPAFHKCDPDRLLDQPSDYFRIWIWTPYTRSSDPVKAADEINGGEDERGTEVSFYFTLPTDQKFNIWFGREVMAKLLKLENRINWKDSQQTPEVEEQDKNALAEAFRDFDFAMQADD